MSLLTRLALLAYPKSFRDSYGTEWTRTVEDLRVHRGLSATRVARYLVVDVLTTAPRMRWESLMSSGKTLLTIVAVIAGAVGLLIGSPAVAIPVIALVAIVALQASRHDQPIAAELTTWDARWYLWLAAAASFLLIGFGALLTEEAGGLSDVAWATWMLSWLTGAIVGAIGLGLGATRLFNRRRT